ncbi:hypothetical protein J1N35_027169 [Gossypium stocksii]|uniref:Reverse transcriptase zinc-binding domain-containing protein n=1 Tax=Gossypium stocksii TaxID=47602 RepID=A0A9D3VB07_9ROSI|nr:hypothetical protein J1N35_027169 [Gossypium stocksii]
MAIGDFNAILSSEDKKGGHVKGHRCKSFGEFMDNAFLHDLGFQEPPFTWHRGFLSERLDRAVGNDAWVEAFPYCTITHPLRIKSDHRPLLMKFCGDDNRILNQPFRFLAGWLHHENFPDFVKNNWNFNGNLQEVLVRNELKNILHHEEMFWKQKSRCEWLKLRDRNTSYFHRRTVMRRKFNKITALRNVDGEWIFDPKTLKTEVVDFFQKLYEEILGSSRPLPLNPFPRLSLEDVELLGKGVTNKEIKTALFDMAPLKAPGSNKFQVAFFQNQWDNIWGTICKWVKKVFEEGIIEPEFNNTLIVLIPKVPNLENFSQFRTISLCSVLYKLVMKIITNKFKGIFPKIIGQEQAGFIAGRSIIDNIIIAQEVLWNGVPTQKFKPVRGIRRADLTHSGLFKIFLSNFCDLSGHKVNARKTNIFFSVGVREPLKSEINDMLGFQEDVLSDSIMRHRCSYMWRAVAKAWPLLHSNMIWSISNGRTVRCWEDNWVPAVGPLNQLWLPEDEVNRIISIPPPSESVQPDILSWSRTTSGPQRVRQFIWLALKQRLLTNSKRVRRGIAQDASCQLCGHFLEDNLHTLRDCPLAKNIWKQVIPLNHFDSFFAAVAELWGIWDGLLLLQKQGYDEVIM